MEQLKKKKKMRMMKIRDSRAKTRKGGLEQKQEKEEKFFEDSWVKRIKE